MGERQKPVQKNPRKNELKSNIAQRNSLVEQEVPGAIPNKLILLGVFLFVVFVFKRAYAYYNVHALSYIMSYPPLNMHCSLRLLTGADFH